MREVTAGPTVTVGGLAKQYMVPGWRLGWSVLHDPTEVLDEVRRRGAPGANTLVA